MIIQQNIRRSPLPEDGASAPDSASLPAEPGAVLCPEGSALGRGSVLYGGKFGFAVGPAAVLSDCWVEPPVRRLEATEVEAEVAKILSVLTQTCAQYQRKQDELAGLDNEQARLGAEILGVYTLLLSDPELHRLVEKNIRGGLTDGLSCVLQALECLGSGGANDFQADAQELKREVARAYHGADNVRRAQLNSLASSAAILIAERLSPIEIAGLPPNIDGLGLREDYQRGSHPETLAKALGIPLVVGLKFMPNDAPLEAVIRNGDEVLIQAQDPEAFVTSVDPLLAQYGNVLVRPDAELLREYQARKQLACEALSVPLALHAPRTLDQVALRFCGVISSERCVEQLAAMRVRDVGLVRTELLLISHNGTIASPEEQVKRYKDILWAFSPDPVTLRTFDIAPPGADPFGLYGEKSKEVIAHERWRRSHAGQGEPSPEEWQQIFSQILRTQVACMLAAHQEVGNARISFPMVESGPQMRDLRQVVAEEWAKIETRTTNLCPVGAFIETARGVLDIRRIIPAVDFINVGSGDLAASVLRQPRERREFLPHHPLNLRAHHDIVSTVRELRPDLELAVCGPMAQAMYMPILGGVGYRTFVMLAADIPESNGIAVNSLTTDWQNLTVSMRAAGNAKSAARIFDEYRRARDVKNH